jgi:hypothetical protein
MKMVWSLWACIGMRIRRTVTTLLSNTSRHCWRGITETGGDVSRYFGEWKPPDQNPKLRSSLLMRWLLHGGELDAGSFRQRDADFSAFFPL